MNLVLVAESEEEIGSPHFRQVVLKPEISAALKRCLGVFMPSAAQDPDGGVTVSLGAKGVVELELVASGEKWGRGPKKDVHSSNRARLDSPAFHLVQALNTLVTAEGDPAIDGFADAARPVSAAEKAMLDAAAVADKGVDGEAHALGRSLGARPVVAGHAGAVHLGAHRQHRRTGRGPHGSGRQDHPPVPRRGQARPAARTGHDLRRRHRGR